MNKVFVGNLPWAVRDDRLKEVFSQFGEVKSANVIADRHSGRSKGFGFVEFSSDEEAAKAISEMDGKDLDGREIKVNEAKPREDSGSASNEGNGIAGDTDTSADSEESSEASVENEESKNVEESQDSSEDSQE